MAVVLLRLILLATRQIVLATRSVETILLTTAVKVLCRCVTRHRDQPCIGTPTNPGVANTPECNSVMSIEEKSRDR